MSQDGTGLLIMAKMEPGEGTQESSAQRIAVYTTIRDMVQEKKAAGVPESFHVAGRGALEVNFEREGRRDMETFLPLILVVIVTTLYCTYRSLRGVLLPLAVVVAAVIWTLGIMAATGFPMFFVTSMMPVVLMAIGVADGIHILSPLLRRTVGTPGHVLVRGRARRHARDVATRCFDLLDHRRRLLILSDLGHGPGPLFWRLYRSPASWPPWSSR